MKEESRLYLQRAENELVIARILYQLSEKIDLQKEEFHLEKIFTFFNGVITHSYYCIFYSAKAILIESDIKTTAPEVHKKTIDAFERYLVKTGKLDLELLKIYRNMIVKADELLGIFSSEKRKRGTFTYHILPRANKDPAKESNENALFFFRNISKILDF